MGQLIQLSDFVGEHGSYQLYITICLFVRYVFLGLMANSGPLLTPDVTFYCSLPMDEVVAIMPNITLLNQTERELEMKEEFKRICQLDLHLYQEAYLNATSSRSLPNNSPAGNRHRFNSTTDKIRECTEFTYELAQDQGRTMTSEFDLVCDRDWLRSLFQSLISAAIVVAYVFWGTFSDRYGRFMAQKICLLVSLLAGLLSIFATEFWTFTITRALCSFGDLGLVVSLTTTVVELVGNQYRGLSVAIVNFGFALGVTILPYIIAYFEDFRTVIVFTVLCHIITMPFVLTNNESVRWLLTNRKFNLAKKELKRISRWNKRHSVFRCYASSCWSQVVSRICCNWSSGKTEDHQHYKEDMKERRKVSSLEEKQAFEYLFERFIEQIESQNFCDPLGPPSGSSTGEQQPESFSQQSRQESVSLQSISTSDNRFLQQILNLDSSSSNNKKQSCISLSLAPTLTHLEQPVQVHFSPDSTYDHRFHLKRAFSCDQLKRQPYDNQLVDFKLADYRNKFKTNQELSGDDLPDDQRQDLKGVLIRNRPAHQQPDCINLVASQLSFVTRISRLFRDKQLMIVVFTIVWTTFNSELQYTSFIIINLEVGEDVYLNYILGCCMEALAAVSASLLLSYAPRRHSLITFWLLISVFCFGLAVAHIDSTWAVWLLALAKFSQSSLSSIASVAAYESFPTFLRQSGSGLVFTLGMLGSVFAPLIFAEFDDHAGMDRVLMTFSFFSLTAATLIYLCLKETRNCELQ